MLATSIAFAKAEETIIPKDSKSEWDFRGELSAFLLGSESAKKLPECKTYEELRDVLEEAIPELIKSLYWGSLQGACSCRLALIRAYLILGDIEKADKLITEAGGSNLLIGAVTQEKYTPIQIPKGEQGGAEQPATALESKPKGNKGPKPESEGRS